MKPGGTALQGDESAVKLLVAHVLKPLYGFLPVPRRQESALVRGSRAGDHARAPCVICRAYDSVRAQNNIFGWLTGLARNEIQRVPPA